MDLERTAFNNLRIHPDSAERTTFNTLFGMYEYTVISFGLTGGPYSWQCYMPTQWTALSRPVWMEGIDTTGAVHIPEPREVETTDRHDDFKPGHHSLCVPKTNGEAQDEDMDSDEDGTKLDGFNPSHRNPFLSGTNGKSPMRAWALMMAAWSMMT
ncbi:MAG: hypothetical protein Q9181_006128 [Wetmoreana brouardii]